VVEHRSLPGYTISAEEVRVTGDLIQD
jgi:hypothetical protein